MTSKVHSIYQQQSVSKTSNKRQIAIEKYRNIGIIAHIDAGKTTFTERILYYTGISHKIGEVHDGQAIMDWMEQERERGITITSAVTTCFWRNSRDIKNNDKKNRYQINIIDTPGHIDFTVEVQRSLRILDGAIVVFDGVAGVEPQSETVWKQANKYKTPRICFVNKLDRIGASFKRSCQSIEKKLSKNIVIMQIPIGEEKNFKGVVDILENKAYYFGGKLGEEITFKEIPESLKEIRKKLYNELIEKVVLEDEILLEKYSNEENISLNEIRATLRKAVLACNLIPIYCGSALKNKAIQLVIDAVIDYLPSPIDKPVIQGWDIKTEKEIQRNVSDNEVFSALVYKIATDPYVGSLSYCRVYSGSLNKGSYVLNANTMKKQRVGRIVRMHANQREEVEKIYAGEVGAIVGLKDTTTGHTLCDLNNPIILEKISFSEPVIFTKIEPKTKDDQEKMSVALSRLAQEDPSLLIKGDYETGETILYGMGELHLEIIVDRMKREFNAEVNVGRPQVAYRETIKKKAQAEGKYIKQSGGRGQYGHVAINIEPNSEKGFEFINKIKGGDIPQEYIPAVEKGIKEAMAKGVMHGYQMVDIKVVLYDGSFHEVDSSEIAFKIAASIAFQEAAKQAELVMLEPIMKVEVIIPAEFYGKIIGDLNGKRGQIKLGEERNGSKVINADVPLSEMFGYATTLRSLTEGRGVFTMEPYKYQEIPKNIVEKIFK